jgi:hypothetical protein
MGSLALFDLGLEGGVDGHVETLVNPRIREPVAPHREKLARRTC